MSVLHTTTTVTRRTAIGAMAAAGVAYAVWPYRPRSLADIPKNRTVLDYWEKWTGPEGQAVQGVVDRFNQMQDRIWVRRLPVSDIAAKSMVAIGGGDPPDLVGLFSYNVSQFAQAGAVMPLDEFKDSDPLGAHHYPSGIWKLLTYHGRQWAGVNTCYTMALYYNKQLFRAAGLDPEKPPKTIAELDAFAMKMNKHDAEGKLIRAGFMQTVPDWWPYIWPVLFDGSWYDPTTDQATATNPANIKAYDWVAGYPKKMGQAAARSFASGFGRSYFTAQNPFLTNKVGMIIQGPWMANVARLFAPSFEYGCGPVPIDEGLPDPDVPRGLLEADVIMIPRGCPHPEEAFTFLRYMQQPDVQETLALGHCKSSPMSEVSPGFDQGHPNPYVAVHDAIAKSPRVQILPQTRVWPQYSSLLTSAFQGIWEGADPTQRLTLVQERVQKLIDVANRRQQQRQSSGAST